MTGTAEPPFANRMLPFGMRSVAESAESGRVSGLQDGHKKFTKMLQILLNRPRSALNLAGEASASPEGHRPRGKTGGQGLVAMADIIMFEDFASIGRAKACRDAMNAASFVPLPIGLRALDVLGVLVERSGELVSKEEIMAAVWGRTASRMPI